MKESMPGTNGWVDGGTSSGRWPDKQQNDVPLDWVGPVTAVDADERVISFKVPYDRERVAEIQMKGKEDPRKLSLEESRLATKNRKHAREDYRTFDGQTRALSESP